MTARSKKLLSASRKCRVKITASHPGADGITADAWWYENPKSISIMIARAKDAGASIEVVITREQLKSYLHRSR